MRDKLEVYYNKFNEDKRLTRRHGNVEFQVTFDYILKYLGEPNAKRVADIGAGTGRYSIPLHQLGTKVVAVEPYKCNLNVLKEKEPNIEAYIGNAKNLKKLADNDFDLVLLFGPMYHLSTTEEKLQALNEAKRIAKPNGIIMIAYISNEYSVVMHGFKSHNVGKCVKLGQLDENFHTQYTESDLYSYSTPSDIDEILAKVDGLTRINIFGADGPSEYMRKEINEMSDDEYQTFINYVKHIAERPDLIGASAHIVDVVKKI